MQRSGSPSALPVQADVKVSISRFMSHVHMSVKEMSKTYLATERRYNYTTPKTFLEQIKLYQNLLSKKRSELTAKIERLEKGLTKLQSTASQVPARSIAPAAGPMWRGKRGASLQGGHGGHEVPEPCRATAGMLGRAQRDRPSDPPRFSLRQGGRLESQAGGAGDGAEAEERGRG